MDPISTLASGWAGAGLLGAVLGWLMLVYLPGRDKLLRDVLAEFRVELAEARRSSIDAHRAELTRLALALEKAIDRAEAARAAMIEATAKREKEQP